jgi:hypothetical protein
VTNIINERQTPNADPVWLIMLVLITASHICPYEWCFLTWISTGMWVVGVFVFIIPFSSSWEYVMPIIGKKILDEHHQVCKKLFLWVK